MSRPDWYAIAGSNARVRLNYGTGLGVKAEGKVLAFCDSPQILIETDDGTRVWWRADMSEVIAEPKPEEPTGLGAVVEAIYGNYFVRVGDAGWVHHEDSSGDSCDWADIAAVRIVSEGVTP